METENFRSNGLLGVASAPTVVPDSDDEMTDERGPRASMQRAQDLAELKRRAIEQQAMHYLDDNDDSDLEIVEDENISPLRHGKKKQYVYVKPNLSKTQRLPSASVRGKRRTLDERSSSQLIAEAAVPLFVGSSKNKGKGADIDQSSLNRILAQRMSTQGQESVRRKEAEWTKRGGRLADMPEGKDHRKRMQDRILALSEQALRKAEGNLSEEQADELDEESDEEWRPEDSHDLQHSDVENETSKEDDDTGFVVHRASDHTSEEETEEENLNPRSRYPRPRHTAVLDSDEENGPPIQRTGRVLVPDSSFTQGPSGSPRIDRTETASLDGTIENETDKENDASMVFDRGEDKENAAIGSPALLSRDRSFKRTSSFALGLQLAEDTTLTGDGQDASASQSKREPFKEISRDEDDLFMSDPVALQRSPPRGSPRLSSPSLSPLQFQKGLEGGPGEFEGFSEDTPMSDAQNDDGEVLSLEPALAISPGLSRLFESSAAKAAASPMVQTALKTGGFSQFFTPNKVRHYSHFHSVLFLQKVQAVRGLDGLRKSNVISLTFDGTAQPSLGISGTLFRKAEDIFGKEQEFVVEEANRKPGEKQQLFVNEHG